MEKKTIIIIVVAVTVVLCLCVIVAAVLFGGTIMAAFGLTAPAADQAEVFMAGLRDGNYMASWSACAPELQNVLGDVGTLQSMVESNGLMPASWVFSSRNISGNEAELEGSVTFQDGRTGTVKINLINTAAGWKLIAFDITPY